LVYLCLIVFLDLLRMALYPGRLFSFWKTQLLQIRPLILPSNLLSGFSFPQHLHILINIRYYKLYILSIIFCLFPVFGFGNTVSHRTNCLHPLVCTFHAAVFMSHIAHKCRIINNMTIHEYPYWPTTCNH
jgi:hypothetical protein